MLPLEYVLSRRTGFGYGSFNLNSGSSTRHYYEAAKEGHGKVSFIKELINFSSLQDLNKSSGV